MADKINEISISFPVGVSLTREDEIALHDVAVAICARYKAANPDRTMWPAGVGSRPLNIMTCGDDEPLEFDDNCFSIDCSERENYDWPCAKCGHVQGDHKSLILNPPAGECEYAPLART